MIISTQLNNTTEQSLVACLQSGSLKDFNRVYDMYAPALLGVITRMMGSREASEDVLLKTFLRIWQNRSSYEPGSGRLFAWMMQEARKLLPAATYETTLPLASIDRTSDQKNTACVVDGLQLEHYEKEALDRIYLKGEGLSAAAKDLKVEEHTLRTALISAIKKIKQTTAV